MSTNANVKSFPKRLWLLRGLPGSGKTTLAYKLGDVGACFSADDYFIGRKFFFSLLGEAHDYCLDRVDAAMQRNVANIAVHNVFSQPWEAEPYFEAAKHFGYEVFVIECQNTFGSVHNVPRRTIDNMRSRWLPLQ